MISDSPYLILNQYRSGSSYKDVVGRLYHFPSRYLKSFAALPAWFVYYEPREGGDQEYFGFGRVHTVYEDTEDVEQNYAEISDYVAFQKPVNFYAGPNGGTWENPKTMRNSVRRFGAPVFEAIVKEGGLSLAELDFPSDPEPQTDALRKEMESLPEPGKRSPAQLRKVRRILEYYERPSSITNQVKSERGATCQLCGVPGFVKRDSKKYCEVHHLFHLAEDPPVECLSPICLVVLCANCHRRMHYAAVDLPLNAERGWVVRIDGVDTLFVTR